MAKDLAPWVCQKEVVELTTEAGFSSVRRVPLENPFNILYEIQP